MARITGSLSDEVMRRLERCSWDGDCMVVSGISDWYSTINYDRGSRMSAHRAVYLVMNGPIDDGLVVRHTCDRPACVNPDHLLVGTQLENERDKWERGRGPIGLDAPSATVPPGVVRQAVAEYLLGGKSQAELAREVGVTQSTIGRWVRAEARRDVSLQPVSVGKGSRIATGIKPCGTRAGWFRHRSEGVPPCEPCRQANITYFRAYRAAQKERVA